jgi:hypothetical protein
MSRLVIIGIAALFAALPGRVQADSRPVCTLSAISRNLPSGAHYEIGLKHAGGAKSVPLRRVATLEEAIHFISAELRHDTCRPPAPAERRACVFSLSGRQILMSYAGPGAASEPVALFSDRAAAAAVLRQMRDSYLCN